MGATININIKRLIVIPGANDDKGNTLKTWWEMFSLLVGYNLKCINLSVI